MPGLNSINLCHWSLLDVVSMLRTVPLSFMETFDIPGSLYEAVSIKGFSDRIFVSPDCSANMQLKDKQKIVAKNIFLNITKNPIIFYCACRDKMARIFVGRRYA